jgi:uncharacterized protein (TIGR03067 family)
MHQLLVAVVLLVGMSVALAQDDLSAQDLKSLQGTWEVIGVVHDGVNQPADKDRLLYWTIAKNELIYPPRVTDDGRVIVPVYKDQFILDASKKPKTIEIVAGKHRPSKTTKAIYILEGDDLKLCVDTMDKGRPTEFESKVGSGWRLLTLKRFKSKK